MIKISMIGDLDCQAYISLSNEVGKDIVPEHSSDCYSEMQSIKLTLEKIGNAHLGLSLKKAI